MSLCGTAIEAWDAETMGVDTQRDISVVPTLKYAAFALHTTLPLDHPQTRLSLSVMRIRNSHGFASQADSRESDSDSQAFLT